MSIQGKADFLKGKNISVYIFQDYITTEKSSIASDIVNDSGFFTLEVELSQIRLLNVTSENHEGFFYGYPGNFELKLIEVDSNDLPIYKKKDMHVLIEKEPSDSINYLSDYILNKTDSVFYDVFQKAYYNKKQQFELPDYRFLYAEKPKIKKEDFLKKFVLYTEALHAGNLPNMNQKIRAQYVDSIQLNYNHDVQMLFVTNYLNLSINEINSSTMDSIVSIANRDSVLSQVALILEQELQFKNAEMMDLAMLFLLKKLYIDPGSNNENVLALLKQRMRDASNLKVKLIAENLIQQLTYLSNGSVAPELSVPEQIAVNKIDKKKKYIFFWSSLAKGVLEELILLKEIQNVYEDDVLVLTISLDNTQKDYLRFVEGITNLPNHYYPENAFGLIEKYQIKSVPFAYFISSTGKIISNDAPLPSENLEGYFKKVLTDENRKNKEFNVGKR